MSYRAIDHLAFRVTSLQEAENYYCDLFGLEVLFREASADGGWASLPDGAGWEEAKAAGIELKITFLARDAFKMALEKSEGVSASGRLSHVCLKVDGEELAHLRSQAMKRHCQFSADRATYINFDDRYGVRWEITSANDLQSNGIGHGRWLNLLESRMGAIVT